MMLPETPTARENPSRGFPSYQRMKRDVTIGEVQ